MFTMTAVSNRLRKGSLSRRNTSTPGFSRPIAFSMPDGVSQMRGGGLPGIGFRDIPFTITPPSRFRSTNSANSSPYPNVPDAVSTGFLSLIPAKLTERSGFLIIFIFSIIKQNQIEERLPRRREGRQEKHNKLTKNKTDLG